MGFPIKKRIASVRSEDVGPAPCGLDLLSAAIESRPRPSVEPATRSTSTSSSIVSDPSRTSSPEAFSDGELSARTPVKSSSSKRARAFPEILLDILNDPTCSSIVSWLPDGQSFAVLDMAEFSSYVLPKYFRRVIFRSFARKLNRWGFRTVKRGTAGNVGPTFEHEHFKRDRKEMVARMYCKSNPSTSKAAAKSHMTTVKSKKADVKKEPAVAQSVSTASIVSAASDQAMSEVTPKSTAIHTALPVATPTSGITPSVQAVAALVPQAAPIAPIVQVGIPARNDEILARLENELLLREMECRRQREALAVQELVRRRQLETQMETSDIALQYAAMKLQRQMLLQQLNGQLGSTRFW